MVALLRSFGCSLAWRLGSALERRRDVIAAGLHLEAQAFQELPTILEEGADFLGARAFTVLRLETEIVDELDDRVAGQIPGHHREMGHSVPVVAQTEAEAQGAILRAACLEFLEKFLPLVVADDDHDVSSFPCPLVGKEQN